MKRKKKEINGRKNCVDCHFIDAHAITMLICRLLPAHMFYFIDRWDFIDAPLCVMTHLIITSFIFLRLLPLNVCWRLPKMNETCIGHLKRMATKCVYFVFHYCLIFKIHWEKFSLHSFYHNRNSKTPTHAHNTLTTVIYSQLIYCTSVPSPFAAFQTNN